MRTTRVLIIESGLENAEFIQDALAEAEERANGSRTFDALHLECPGDALEVLAAEPFDVVLLGVQRADRSAFDTFAALRSRVPAVAIVLIVDPTDAGFGRSLLRHGLQDYLIRSEFDYLPLARAVENSIERQRVLTAAVSVQMTDPLTGLLSAQAFAVMAERELRWMAEADVEGALVIMELEPDAEDLAVLEAANVLLSVCRSGSLLCRWTSRRFVALGRAEQVADLAGCPPGMRVTARPVRIGATLDDLLDDEMKSLCENGLAYSATAP